MWNSHTSIKLLQTFPQDVECNLCENVRYYEPDKNMNETPWFRIPAYDFDLCDECVNTFYEGLIPTKNIGPCEYCVVCDDSLRAPNPTYSTQSKDYFSDAYRSIYVCENCYKTNKPHLVNVNQSGIENDREQYIIAKHLDYDALTMPPQLLSKITAERNKLFIELLDSLTRLPDTYDNILEWTLITDLTPCECDSIVKCGFAINLINHKVASILSDNHGRVAMNVVYDTYEDYLREEAEFNQLNDTFAFNTELCLDDKEENTQNFGEYIRRKHKLGFYYG